MCSQKDLDLFVISLIKDGHKMELNVVPLPVRVQPGRLVLMRPAGTSGRLRLLHIHELELSMYMRRVKGLVDDTTGKDKILTEWSKSRVFGTHAFMRCFKRILTSR